MDGINKWTVVKKSWAKQVGEFIFLSYISVIIFLSYISVSTAAGAKGLYIIFIRVLHIRVVTLVHSACLLEATENMLSDESVF